MLISQKILRILAGGMFAIRVYFIFIFILIYIYLYATNIMFVIFRAYPTGQGYHTSFSCQLSSLSIGTDFTRSKTIPVWY